MSGLASGTRQRGESRLGWIIALALLATSILLTADPFGWFLIPHSFDPRMEAVGEAPPATSRGTGKQAPLNAHPPRQGQDTGRAAGIRDEWGQIGSAAMPRQAFALAGRVLDGEGFPLSGIAVRAGGERFFGPVRPEARAEGSGFSGDGGLYAITGLAEGQYRVSAAAPGYRPAETTARTGAGDVDLVLEAEKTISVHGRVVTHGGAPLGGARVIPNLSPAIATLTDSRGNYQAGVRLNAYLSGFDIRFEHPQHLPQSIRLDERHWQSTDAVELNISLEPIAGTTRVQGVVEGTTGEGIGGETVILYSSSLMQRYEAVTGGGAGAFDFPEVAMATDYMVSVRPVGPYRDYARRDIEIMNPTELLIRLDPLEEGSLHGRMTDVRGKPVPNFTLTLRSTIAARRSQEVTSEDNGEYEAYDVPVGSLVFQSDTSPFYRITALKRSVEEEEVPIVLDWGPYEVRGRVLDEMGVPLLAPEVYLTWSHTQAGVRSTAIRRTASDAEGYFRFQGLGSGPHQVTVSIPGYRTGRMNHNVGNTGRDIVVQLEPEM